MSVTSLFTRAAFAAVISTAIGAEYEAAANPSSDPGFLSFGYRVASGPDGHRKFCRRNPDECSEKSPNGGIVRMNDAIWQKVMQVNGRVNSEIEPGSDRDIYGREEYWSFPDGRGDCEDYALEKRRRLHDAGFPYSSLLLTFVRLPDGRGHAVLTVRTTGGDFFLDNLQADPVPVGQSDYTLISAVNPRDTSRWLRITDVRQLPGRGDASASVDPHP